MIKVSVMEELTSVITHAFNNDFIFFIQRSTSMRLVCISNVSYLQLIFNLQLKNEHVHEVDLTRWSLGMFFMGFFRFFVV